MTLKSVRKKMHPRTNKSEYAQALDLLTRYLTLREHSRHELREKLARRFEPDLIERALAAADKNGWLPQESAIAAHAALVWQRKLKSRQYIEEQLRKRQLPLPPADDEIEVTTVRTLVERKFGQPEKLSADERARALRFLTYRGFDERTIGMVLNAES